MQITRRAVFVRSVFNAKIWGLRRLLWCLFNDVDLAHMPEMPEDNVPSLDGFAALPGVGAYLRQFGFELSARWCGPPLYPRRSF